MSASFSNPPAAVYSPAEKDKGPLSVASMRRNLSAARAAWHSGCVACGEGNGQGLRLEFRVRESGQVESTFDCGPAFQGYPGFLHGGIVATLLDAAMTNCLFAQGIIGLTAELKIRYRHPVRIGEAARVCAWPERSSHRLHGIRSQLVQDGVIKAAASSRFLETDLRTAGEGPKK